MTLTQLDALASNNGQLCRTALEHLPADYLLSQGEAYNDYGEFIAAGKPSMLLALHIKDIPPARCCLSLVMYQALLIAESLGQGLQFV